MYRETRDVRDDAMKGRRGKPRSIDGYYKLS